MRNKPIGVFDSGMGGLTAVKTIKALMPGENVVYFGDTGRVPYGDKSKATILKYAKQNISFMKFMGCKTILAACGTVSSYIYTGEIDSSVMGVIDASCTAAVKETKNNKIGVMGTRGAVSSKSYEKCIKFLNKNTEVYQQACPLLVTLIEGGYHITEPGAFKIVLESYLSPLIKEGIDTLILGCTHYPIVQAQIKDITHGEIKLINSGEEAAKSLKRYLQSKNLNSLDSKNGKYEFYVSGDADKFALGAQMFWDNNLPVKSINIEVY